MNNLFTLLAIDTLLKNIAEYIDEDAELDKLDIIMAELLLEEYRDLLLKFDNKDER